MNFDDILSPQRLAASTAPIQAFSYGVWVFKGLGFRVLGFSSLGFRVWRLGFRVSDSSIGFGV